MENAHKNLKISCILFDLDNTLIETRKADSKVCEKITKILKDKLKISQDEASIMSTNFLSNFRKCPDNPRMSLDTWRTKLWSKALGETYKEDADNIYQQWLLLRYRYLALTPDITSLLDTLRKSYFVGLITNGPSAAQWEKIDRLNLRNLFDIILVSGDLPWEKPRKEIFYEACGYLGVGTKNCIMVGDKLETDILGGIEAELGGTVWVPLTSHCIIGDTDPNPDYIIKNVLDLKGLLVKYGMGKGGFRNRMENKLRFSKLTLSDVDDCNSNSSDGS